MRKIVALAAVAALSACSQSEPAPEPEAPAAAEPAVAEPLAADGQPTAGMYKVTTDEGVFMEDVKADGTYVQTKDGEVVETGKWEQKDPATYCYTSDEEGAVQECNTEAIGDDGVWTSTDAEGNVATIERVTA